MVVVSDESPWCGIGCRLCEEKRDRVFAPAWPFDHQDLIAVRAAWAGLDGNCCDPGLVC